MAARLSIIVPTPDGDGLDNLFASLDGQLFDRDEVIIVGDTHDGPLPDVARRVQERGHRWVELDAGHHCWGHCQINHGIAQAAGEYLVFIDDDDVFARGALAAIRRAIGEQTAPRPLMFKFFAARLGRTLPETRAVVESGIGGHCLVAPNVPGQLGAWTCRYGGDFDWIVSTLALWPIGPAWYDDVIALAR